MILCAVRGYLHYALSYRQEGRSRTEQSHRSASRIGSIKSLSRESLSRCDSFGNGAPPTAGRVCHRGGLTMKLLPLDTLGAHEVAPNRVQFGLFLPWVSAHDGHQLVVKILHEQDQFLQDIPPLVFPLQHTLEATYG